MPWSSVARNSNWAALALAWLSLSTSKLIMAIPGRFYASRCLPLAPAASTRRPEAWAAGISHASPPPVCTLSANHALLAAVHTAWRLTRTATQRIQDTRRLHMLRPDDPDCQSCVPTVAMRPAQPDSSWWGAVHQGVPGSVACAHGQPTTTRHGAAEGRETSTYLLCKRLPPYCHSHGRVDILASSIKRLARTQPSHTQQSHRLTLTESSLRQCWQLASGILHPTRAGTQNL
jgi:hypothetical protein